MTIIAINSYQENDINSYYVLLQLRAQKNSKMERDCAIPLSIQNERFTISLIFGVLNKYVDRTLFPIWKGIPTSSLRNLRRIQLALRDEQLYVECAVILKNLYPSNLLSICPSLFELNLSKTKYSIYEKLSRVLSVVGDSMLALFLYFCVNFYKCVSVAFKVMIWPAFCAASSTVTIAFKLADIKLVIELWGLFSEVREKSVVGFRTYLHFS